MVCCIYLCCILPVGKVSFLLLFSLCFYTGSVEWLVTWYRGRASTIKSYRQCRALQRAFLWCYCHLKSRDTVTLTNHPSLETGRPGGNGLQTSTDRTKITQVRVNQHLNLKTNNKNNCLFNLRPIPFLFFSNSNHPILSGADQTLNRFFRIRKKVRSGSDFAWIDLNETKVLAIFA